MDKQYTMPEGKDPRDRGVQRGSNTTDQLRDEILHLYLRLPREKRRAAREYLTRLTLE